MEEIRVLFVLPENCKTHDDASDIMLQAFESCKRNVVNVSWLKESDFTSTDLSKTDFVVFQDFEGKNFESLKESKCARILGPWCLLVCLTDGRSIPNFPWPIYNVAMAGCVVSCSHIPKAKKLEIKEKVQLMGGCCTDSLMTSNTHLVTESVKSEKYLQAAESGVKLMVSTWVETVWKASQTNKIHCDDEEFQKYRCLPFHNLTISSTGFPNVEMRSQLAQTVAKNGGNFTNTLSLSNTDVLVVYGVEGVLSRKYKAARASPNIYCVSVDWIHDSIEKGYALSHSLYTVKKGTSTPTKHDETRPDFSIISAIGDTTTAAKCGTTLEETMMHKKVHNKRKCPIDEEMGQIIDELDIKKAKKAGQYLDGCSVYLAGFKPEQREKLAKILNLSGATRYDDISDRLTHIIVGDPSCPEVKIIKTKNYSVSLVSLQWLLASMEQQQAVDEENYLISLHDSRKESFSSPLGQKGLTLLRSNKTLTSVDLETGDSDNNKEEDDLMQHYMNNTPKEGEETDTLVRLLRDNSKFNTHPGETEVTETTSQSTNIFQRKKFIIVNFPPEESQDLKEQIESELGVIVPKTYKGIPDYVVAPMFIETPIQISALEIVNNLWICESLEENQEVEIKDYHRPLVIGDSAPLKNCVVSISGYTSFERRFLRELIDILGGMSQQQFARVEIAETGVKTSTHLVSLEAEGNKYNAALKWGLPVVSKNWLFECAKSGKLEPEEGFLVGESKVGPPNVKTPQEVRKIVNSEKKSSRRKQLTPLSQVQPLHISKEKTPMNRKLFDGAVETPEACSQVTPINKLMEEVRRTNLLGTPKTPEIPKTWYDVDTPESPFGAFIQEHLSAKSKKQLMRYINCIPDFVPPPEAPKSTPFSEVKRRWWKKFLGEEDSPLKFSDESSTPQQCDKNETQDTDADSENVFVNTKLQQIQAMASGLAETRRSSRGFQPATTTEAGTSSAKDSQPFTVGWDYQDEAPTEKIRIFIISGVENEQRQSIVEKIEHLGGQVSDLSSYDPKCTHLICSKPGRNEKTLSCMAAGKWILHVSYVDKCVSAGKFLPEEEFEFGNPKAKENINLSFDKETEFKNQAIHWWRKEVSRRGYGAFNDMRAIVVAQKKEPIVRVIEAGGGQVVDVRPPFNENVHLTHCLLEVKSVPDFSVYVPLAQRGIWCINTLYISDFLYNRINRDIKDAVLPHFSKYYL